MTTRTRSGLLALPVDPADDLHVRGVRPRQRGEDEGVADVLQAVDAGADRVGADQDVDALGLSDGFAGGGEADEAGQAVLVLAGEHADGQPGGAQPVGQRFDDPVDELGVDKGALAAGLGGLAVLDDGVGLGVDENLLDGQRAGGAAQRAQVLGEVADVEAGRVEFAAALRTTASTGCRSGRSAGGCS